MTAIVIRPASLADLPDIAHIHVRSWQQAYAGQLPQDYLDRLDAGARLKVWETIFREPGTGRDLLVAQQGGKPLGFASFGPGRDEGRRDGGELYAIYLLQEAWGLGAGHALFTQAMQALAGAGFRSAYVWVLDSNAQAIQAYQRWGGRLEPGVVGNDTIGGMAVKELMLSFTLQAPELAAAS